MYSIYTPALMPLLTALLQPSAPAWFRAKVSEVLSLVPLREYGVRQVIEFIAASYPASSQQSNDAGTERSRGPMLSIEALEQSAKLLSSVPKSIPPEDYFRRIAPQLLSLLDGEVDTEMAKAAAHTIARVLGRKATGAPGSIGWVLFVEPIHHSLDPETAKNDRKGDSVSDTVVPEKQLGVSIRRLAILVSSHPNPGLVKRLVGPVLVSLWGLLCFSRTRHIASWWGEASTRLIGDYLRLGSTGPDIDRLIKSVTWDGPSHWIFGPGSEGGVEIRRRTDDRTMLEVLSEVDTRVSILVDLMSSDSVDNETVGTIFLQVVKGWLFPSEDLERQSTSLTSPEDDPLQTLVIAKLTQAMLQRLEKKITTNAEKMIELSQQLLKKYVTSVQLEAERQSGRLKPTYADLGHIVEARGSNETKDQNQSSAQAMDDADSTSIALSLLTAVLSSDFDLTPQIRNLAEDILSSLKKITDGPLKRRARPALIRSAQNVELQLMSMIHPDEAAKLRSQSNRQTQDREKLNQAFQKFASSEAPTRVQAVQIMHTLIESASTVVDVPTLTSLLLREGITDDDEYVYLSVVRTLAGLVQLDPQLVAGLVSDSFVDVREEEESGLDGRLRMGEALNGMVDTLATPALGARVTTATEPRAAIRKIYDAATLVAGRRGQRPKTLNSRRKKQRLEEMKKKREAKQSGGIIPSLEMSEEDEETLEPAEQRLLEQIVGGWENTGLEEDVRLRSSALDLLGQILEKALGFIPEENVDQAVDLALAVLAIETPPEKAILRRAAALLFMSLIRAMDRSRTIILNAEKWEHIEKTLAWMGDTDQDELVSGHIRTVLESLDAWKMNSLLESQGELPPGLELRTLRGLDIHPGQDTQGKKFKIEEIE
jgi:hypothetical protein